MPRTKKWKQAQKGDNRYNRRSAKSLQHFEGWRKEKEQCARHYKNGDKKEKHLNTTVNNDFFIRF